MATLRNKINCPLKIINIMGKEDSIAYLENILRVFRDQKFKCSLFNSQSQVFWIMEFFGFGLSLPFTYYEMINEIIQLYNTWISAMKYPLTMESIDQQGEAKCAAMYPHVPQPIFEEPNTFCSMLIDQFYYVFLTRTYNDLNAAAENMGYQAMNCIQILLILNSLTENCTKNVQATSQFEKRTDCSTEIEQDFWKRDKNEPPILTSNGIGRGKQSKCRGLNPHLWEHILIFLLKINEVILTRTDQKIIVESEELTLGGLVGNQSLKTLFDIWTRSGSLYFPSPVLWTTLKLYCQTSWKYQYLPLVEQWSCCCQQLTVLLLAQNSAKSDIAKSQISTNVIPLELISQYWFKILRILGAPQEIIYHIWKCFHGNPPLSVTEGSQTSPDNMSTVNKGYSVVPFSTYTYPNDKVQMLLFPHYQTLNCYNDVGDVSSIHESGTKRHHSLGVSEALKSITNSSNINKEQSHFNAKNMTSLSNSNHFGDKYPHYFAKNHIHLNSLIFLRYLSGISRIIDMFLADVDEPNEIPVMHHFQTSSMFKVSKSTGIPTQHVESTIQEPHAKKRSPILPPKNKNLGDIKGDYYRSKQPHGLSKQLSMLSGTHVNTVSSQPTTCSSQSDFSSHISKADNNLPNQPLPAIFLPSSLPPSSFMECTPDFELCYKLNSAIYTKNSCYKSHEEFSEMKYLFRKDSTSKNASTSNLLFNFFGDWIFGCASLNTNVVPFANEPYFLYGKAEACGTICRIINDHAAYETILPYHLSNFYYIIHNVLAMDSNRLKETKIDVCQACILLNSYRIFSLDLPGSALIFSDFLTLIHCVFTANPLTLSQLANVLDVSLMNDCQYIAQTSVSTFALRNAAISVLASTWALPTHFPNAAIEMDLFPNDIKRRDTLEYQPNNYSSIKILTYAVFRKPLIDLIYIGIDTETYAENLQMLIAIMTVILQDFAIHLRENAFTNKLTLEGHFQSAPMSITRSSIPLSLFHAAISGEPAVMSIKPVENSKAIDTDLSQHPYWCFDCIFQTFSDKLMAILDSWWLLPSYRDDCYQHKRDHRVAMCALAALGQMAKINILIYKPLCVKILKYLCDHVVRQICSPETYAQRHTRDFHTFVVETYNCLASWLTHHSGLLDDSSLLKLLIHICEIGISGLVLMRDQKEAGIILRECRHQPISKRVAVAAGNLLTLILTLKNTGNGNKAALTDITQEFYLSNNINKKYYSKYFSVNNCLILGITHKEDSDNFASDSSNSCKLVIYNVFGRHVWKLQHANLSKHVSQPSQAIGSFTPYLQPIKFNPLKAIINQFLDVTLNQKLQAQVLQYNLPVHLKIPADIIFTTKINQNQLLVDQLAQFHARRFLKTADEGFVANKHAHIFTLADFKKALSSTTNQIIEYSVDSVTELEDYSSPFSIFKNFSQLCNTSAYNQFKFVEDLNLPRLYLSQTGLLNFENFTSSNESCDPSSYITNHVKRCNFLGVFNSASLTPVADSSIQSSVAANFKQFLLSLAAIEYLPNENVFIGYMPAAMTGYNNNIHPVHMSKIKHLATIFALNPAKNATDGSKLKSFLEFWSTLAPNEFRSHHNFTLNFNAICELQFVCMFNKNLNKVLSAVQDNESTFDEIELKREFVSQMDSVQNFISPYSQTKLEQIPGPQSFKPTSMCDAMQPKIIFFAVWVESYDDIISFPTDELTSLINHPNYDFSSSQTNTNVLKPGNKDFCVIFIYPLENYMYQIHLSTSYQPKGGGSLFPLFQDILLPHRCLVPLLCEAIIQASFFQKYENESHGYPDIVRKATIQNVIYRNFVPADSRLSF